MSRQNILTLITTHCALTNDPSCVTVALGYTQPHYSQVRTHMKYATIYQGEDKRSPFQNGIECSRKVNLPRKEMALWNCCNPVWVVVIFYVFKMRVECKAISANLVKKPKKKLWGSRFCTPFGWFSTIKASMIQRLDLFTRSFSIWWESS